MFNAADLVLILLSMFSLVSQENRRAVWFLFEISLSFDLTTGRFRMTRQNYDALLQLMGPLSALASYRGMMRDATFKPTVLESYRMLSSILHPIIGGLSAAELREVHDSADEGFQLLLIELRKLELIVKTWTHSSTDSRETVPMVGFSFSARAYTPLRHVCAKVVGCWTSKVAMDEHLSTAILSYWACYAAAPTRVSVRRAQRVKPRKLVSSEPTVPTVASVGATIRRRNRVATHMFGASKSINISTTSRASLQRAMGVRTRKSRPSISGWSIDSDPLSAIPCSSSANIFFSSAAPELGASCTIGNEPEQHPYFLRRAVTAPNLPLGSEQSTNTSCGCSSSSSSSVAWGIGCSSAELAATGHIRQPLVDTSSPTHGSYNWADARQSFIPSEHDDPLPNNRGSGFMFQTMPETPLKHRARQQQSSSSASLSFSIIHVNASEYSSGSRSIDFPHFGTPYSSYSPSFMELPLTPLKQRILRSFDSFEGQYDTTHCTSSESDLAAANISPGSTLPLQFASLEASFAESATADNFQDEDWDMVTPPVAPKRALPPHMRALKRKRAMRDLRTGWGFPSHNTSLGPYAPKTMYATKITADSRLLPSAIDTICDAWWATPRTTNTAASSPLKYLTPNAAPTNGIAPHYKLDSRLILAPSPVPLSSSTLATSLASTPLQTPRASTEDLLFAEWAEEWELEQCSIWTSALGDRKRQFSEEMIKPPRMNAATKLVVDMGRMIGALWSR